MCLEGGCGACIVTLTGRHPVSGDIKSWAVNSVCKDDRRSIYSLRILFFFSSIPRVCIVFVVCLFVSWSKSDHCGGHWQQKAWLSSRAKSIV